MIILPFYDPQQEGGSGDTPGPSFPTNWVPMSSNEGTVSQETPTQPVVQQTAEGSSAAAPAATPEQGGASGEPQPNAAAQPAATPAAAAQPEPTPAPVVKPWDEVIKDVDKTKVLSALGSKREIMKALGVSDFVADLSDYYDSTGNVDPYLNARAVDYTKMSDEAIFRLKIDRDHKDASPQIKEMILADELARYRVQAEEGQEPDPQKVAYANYQREQAAKAIRESLIAEQQKFTIPTKEATTNTFEAREAIIKEIQAEHQAKVIQQTKEFTERNNADPRTQKLVATKTLPIYDGVNFGVDKVDDILKYTTGEKSVWDLFTDEKGEPNLDLFYKMVAFAMNEKGYTDQIFNAGKTAAHKTEIEEGGDAGHTQVQEGAPPIEKLSPWQQIEKRGVPG